MSHHYTIIGNWKMNLDIDQSEKLVDNIQKKIKPHTHVTNVVCPSFIAIPAVNGRVEKDKLRVGAQDIAEADSGLYTGDVSGPMLKGLVEYVIVGHSEKRKNDHDVDTKIAKKLAAAVRNDFIPVLCIGDKLNDREDGHSKRVIVDQLHVCLSELTADDIKGMKIVYEPVWAISNGDGHGNFAKPSDVKEMVTIIRQTIEELYGEAASSHVEVLYGGSVNPDNCRAYLELQDIQGLLVGGASLNYEQFSKIVEEAQQIADGK